MNCCDANGDCRQGRDCPARANKEVGNFSIDPDLTDYYEDEPMTGVELVAAIVIVICCAIGSVAAVNVIWNFIGG